jgi:tRNA (cmo5U34)-methyltransferase
MTAKDSTPSYDNVGDSIAATNAGWTFSGDVPDNFSEHVRRSIPLYDIGHDVVCKLSDYFVSHDSICYEIGVSVGELIAKLARHNQSKKAKWTGIDVEEAMVRKARENTIHLPNVAIELADAVLYDFEKADLIVSYYTIQFISPKFRQDLINRIYESLNWSGAFIWFEKVRGPDARFQDILTTLYTDFKLDQKFTPEEIVAKTRSLKGILEPFSTQGNLDLLKRAGFVDIMTVMKYLCFEGFLAIK